MSKHESFETASSLHIFRASAGSGKTYRLTGEYLRLLFSNPQAYRHILAVTFTNKATEEMKSRIVKELYMLSSGEKSDYLVQLSDEYQMNEARVRTMATKMLATILHDYSAFSISTIDRFFQQTMRAFAREMGLSGSYNIELDTSAVLKETIDLMLYELEKSENKQLLQWLLQFTEEKIESGGTWRIEGDIAKLSQEIFKEDYKNLSTVDIETIRNKDILSTYKKTLQDVIRSHRQSLKRIGERGVEIMKRHNLLYSDFKDSSRSPFLHFEKWRDDEYKEPTQTFINLADDETRWYTKSTAADIKASIIAAYNDGLNSLVVEAIALFENNTDYNTVNVINAYFHMLGIIYDVSIRIQQYQKEHNILFLSDTTELLNKIIADSESPFVYEKTGTRIDNYMIDEFQDTSTMQWENFRPLIDDSISSGNYNLIVGDVKQSIYRWRNSDWKILDEQVFTDFATRGVVEHSLETNWRSDKNIVAFNNAFFVKAASLLQRFYNDELEVDSDDESVQEIQKLFSQRIEGAYAHVFQEYPESKNGSEGAVEVTFIEEKSGGDDKKKILWKEQVLEDLPLKIEDLQRQGFRLKDIAILVRTKDDGTLVANRLLEYKEANPSSQYSYDIISDEALKVSSSDIVKMVVAIMHSLKSNSTRNDKIFALFQYLCVAEKRDVQDAVEYIFSRNEPAFPDNIESALRELSSLSIYEMVESLFEMVKDGDKDKNETVYVQAFLDLVLDYTMQRSPDLHSFLDWWGEDGIKKSVFTPEGQDAIRIMTIHKSKGLGFPVAILPFVNWDIDHKPSQTNILWCRPDRAPFDAMGVVPVKYSKTLNNTIFRKDYLTERIQAFIDNINLLYVAFTRPKNRLIVYSPKPTPPKTGEIVPSDTSKLLWNAISSPSLKVMSDDDREFVALNNFFDEDTENFKMGEESTIVNKEEQKEDSNTVVISNTVSVSFEDRLRLKISSLGFFSGDSSREYGNLMHEVLSRIETADDLEDAVELSYIDGELTLDEKHEVYHLLKEAISLPEVKEWYDGSYDVLNEVEIIDPQKGLYRPDRILISEGKAIVVDYKFGEIKEPKYLSQLSRYMHLLSRMGYNDVEGFIYYVKLKEIVAVNV